VPSFVFFVPSWFLYISASINSHRMCSSVPCTSCTRGVGSTGTATCTSASVASLIVGHAARG